MSSWFKSFAKLYSRLIVFACLLTVVGSLSKMPACGQTPFDSGLALLKRRDFRGAITYFDQCLQRAPGDDKAIYYKALCLHYLGDKDSAKLLYERCVRQSPGTAFGKLAAAAIAKINGAPTSTNATPQSSSHGTQSYTHGSIPRETRVYFRMNGHKMMVPGKINGAQFDFCFDTGAEGVLVRKEDFDAAQLRLPVNAKTQEVPVYGDRLKCKVFPADVTVGGITRRVNISVTDSTLAADSLLGQTWLGGFEYELDHQNNFVTFRPPRGKETAATASAARDAFAVPFTLRGEQIIVEVTVPGGRKTRMRVDSGIEHIMLTEKNASDLGLTIPPSAVKRNTGTGSNLRDAWVFTIDELRLGNIIARDQEVVVAADPLENKDDMGQLGMAFFRNWRYTVDRKNQVLRFFH